MPTLNAKARAALKEIRGSAARKVKIAVADIDGVLRGKTIHTEKFISAVEGGLGFCNVVFGWDLNDACYDNVKHTGWHSGYPDDTLTLDLGTFRRVPWDDGTPFFLGDFGTAVCPRSLLKRVAAAARAEGFEASFGAEFEWFNFKETPESLAAKNFTGLQTLEPGMFGYSLLRSGLNQGYFRALMDQLGAFGVPLEGLHTETGPGVYEGAILRADPLEAADRAVLFKSGVKEIAYRFNLAASFMARWSTKLPGCGGHLHQSLWKGGKNAFFDERDPQKMSATFRSYLAGQLSLMPELLALYAPTVNSYKRLVEGYWAPTHANWGIDNRTTALRVIAGGAKSTRVETRVSGADINPYLAVAAALASGLYGIRRKLKLEAAPVRGSAYAAQSGKRLAKNLAEAAALFARSAAARELFGDGFVDHFAATRDWECRQYEKAVTTWELERYFEII